MFDAYTNNQKSTQDTIQTPKPEKSSEHSRWPSIFAEAIEHEQILTEPCSEEKLKKP